MRQSLSSDDRALFDAEANSLPEPILDAVANLLVIASDNDLSFEFDDAASANSNFDNHEFYLSAKANISEKLTMVAEFEYEHTPEKLILPVQAFAQYKAYGRYVNVRAGLFHVDSFFHKSLRNTLTEDQFASYTVVLEDRGKFRSRAQIELTANTLEQGVPLSAKQRRELIELLLAETKPSRKSGQYEAATNSRSTFVCH